MLGTVRGAGAQVTLSFTVEPGGIMAPAAGSVAMRLLGGMASSCWATPGPTTKPACMSASLAWSTGLPPNCGMGTGGGPVETTSFTALPRDIHEPAGGDWSTTVSAGSSDRRFVISSAAAPLAAPSPAGGRGQ